MIRVETSSWPDELGSSANVVRVRLARASVETARDLFAVIVDHHTSLKSRWRSRLDSAGLLDEVDNLNLMSAGHRSVLATSSLVNVGVDGNSVELHVAHPVDRGSRVTLRLDDGHLLSDSRLQRCVVDQIDATSLQLFEVVKGAAYEVRFASPGEDLFQYPPDLGTHTRDGWASLLGVSERTVSRRVAGRFGDPQKLIRWRTSESGVGLYRCVPETYDPRLVAIEEWAVQQGIPSDALTMWVESEFQHDSDMMCLPAPVTRWCPRGLLVPADEAVGDAMHFASTRGIRARRSGDGRLLSQLLSAHPSVREVQTAGTPPTRT